jgi:hypothetical protein
MTYRTLMTIALLALLPRPGRASFLIDVSASGDAGAGVLSILPSSPTGAILDLSPSAVLPAAPAPPAFDPGDTPVVVQSGQTVNAADLPPTFTSLQVQNGGVLLVDSDVNVPATGAAHDVRIAGSIRFAKDVAGNENLGIISDIIVVEASARITMDVGRYLSLHAGEQLFVGGRIKGGDYTEISLFTGSPSGPCVFGGRIRTGASSRIDFRHGNVFLQPGSDLRLGPDGEVDVGGPTVVMAGKLRGRGKPDLGAGTQLFIRTQQLVGPDGKMKLRGGFGDVLLGVTDGKHWDTATFSGTIDVRGGTDAGSVQIAAQMLSVAGTINAQASETGGTIAFDSASTPVLPACKDLRVDGGLTNGSVTLNGAPICP